MKRCHGFITCLFFSLLLCNGFCAESLPASAARLPNVLLVVVDDLGMGDLHSFSATAATETPAIDALAAQGMRFGRFYTDSTCSASRASLLTGQHPARLGFHPVARGVSPEVVTMPEWLRDLGYSTSLVGKWHAGELNVDAMPPVQGFDTWFGFLNQWFLQGPDADGKPAMRAPVYQDPWLQDERGHWQQYPGYLPDILTQRATDEIVALGRAGKPWFLWYATPLVHGPLHTPPDAGAKDASDDDKYRAMLRHLDSNIAELVAALDKSGQRDNTIIIFLSDNGAPEKRAGSNAGFEGGKAHYSEGAVRTPMFWVDPAHVMPASRDDRAITIADIFPTLAARLGHPLPFATDGVDFNALSNIGKINQRPLYWMSRGDSSALSPDKQWRIAQDWVFREPQSFQLLHIDGDAVADAGKFGRYLNFRIVRDLQQDFLVWLDDVAKTRVQQQMLPDGGKKITGNDFLRTPLKEWDFYIAVTPDPVSQTDQVLAEQQGVWSLRYKAAEKQLVMDMYGHHWAVPFTLPQSCTLIGLNADMYDRYTNVGKTVNPGKLLLSINGAEVARTEWHIDSLADVQTSEPTWVGLSAAQTERWQGKLSAAAFYHRANRVGEWPFFIDETALGRELCSQLP